MNENSIDKRADLSRKEFINEYVIRRKPVVITDSFRKWKDIGKLTPEFFKKNYGTIKRKIGDKEYLLGDYIDLMCESTYENPAPYPYNLNMEKTFPELIKYFTPHISYSISDRISHPMLKKSFLNGTTAYELFFGGCGSSYPFLHFDIMHLDTQITQVFGNKEFILFDPSQIKYVYPRKDNLFVSEVNDIFKPDLKKFPLFKNATPLSVIVRQGETLFFPTGWWHITRIHSPCISYGRVQLNSKNWNDFTKDNIKLFRKQHPQTAFLANFYLKTLGVVMNAQETVMKSFF